MGHLFSYSNETIAFQDSAFLNDLTAVFDEMQDEIKTAKEAEKRYPAYSARLEELIMKHTGMKLGVEFDEWGPAVTIPQIDRNHILLKDYFDPSFYSSATAIQHIRRSKDHRLVGTVDLKNARVSGFFSEVKLATVMMSGSMAYGTEFTSEECAAVFLHEVGHIFVYCEYLNRMRTTNQILAGIARGLDESATKDERTYILEEGIDALNIKTLTAEELIDQKNEIAYQILVTSHIKQIHAIGGGAGYDQTSYEFLSDQFAARHNAARPIVTALDKMYRRGNNISYRSTSKYIFIELGKILIGIGAIFLAMVAPLPTIMMLPSLLTVILITFGTDAHHYSYDRVKTRYQRMRSEIIQQLKDKNIPNEVSKSAQADIKVIDDILAQVEDRRQFLSIVLDFIHPASRSRQKAFEFQEKLERLANNDLFMYANKMQTA